MQVGLLAKTPFTPMQSGTTPDLVQRVINDSVSFDMPRPNLLTNGGFEQWPNGYGPFDTDGQESAAGWFVMANRFGDVAVQGQVASTLPAGSVSAIRITGTNNNAALVAQTIDPNVCALNGVTVSLSFHANAPVGAQINAVIGIIGDIGFQLPQPVAANGDWQLIQLTASIPEGPPTPVAVVLGVIGPFEVDIDNASLVVGSTPSIYQPVVPPAGTPGAAGEPGPQGIPGPQGAPGPAGSPGSTGADGQDGQRGSLWFTGHGPPQGTPSGAQDGDMYLDVDTGEVWTVQTPVALTAASLSSGTTRSAPTAGVRALTV